MAHCTGCGLWLRESELFCGICGLEKRRCSGKNGEPREYRGYPSQTHSRSPLSASHLFRKSDATTQARAQN